MKKKKLDNRGGGTQHCLHSILSNLTWLKGKCLLSPNIFFSLRVVALFCTPIP